MTTIHGSFACLHRHVQKFGGRRRRCRDCSISWRVRSKRRGKKVHRRARVLPAVLVDHASLERLARARRLSPAQVRYRLRQEMVRELSQPLAQAFPPGPCALLGDGLWFRFNRQRYVLYVLALKPLGQDRAYFLDPVLLKGRECLGAWEQALSVVPSEIQQRVQAFVSDGLRGLGTLARVQGWRHQRCHFHLISQLELQRGRRLKDYQERTYRDQTILTVRKILKVRNQVRLRELVSELQALLGSPWCTTRLGQVVRDFLRELPDFRTYLKHPKLNLPTTTGTIESMNSLLRKALGKLNSPDALMRWAVCFVRTHPSLCCRGFRSKHTPN